MGTVLNKSDVQFDNLSLFRQPQPEGGYLWYVIVGYVVTTTEGEIINRDRRLELTPAQVTAASNFLVGIKNRIKSEEGMV